MTLDDVDNSITIDKYALDQENIKQPQLIFDISQAYAVAQQDKREAKLAVEETYADLDKQVRKGLAERGEKMSEPQIKLHITTMPKMKEAERTLLVSERRSDQWMGAYEAIKAKGYALNNMGDLYASNYFSTESGGRTRTDAKDVAAQKARDADSARRRAKREA